MFIWLCCLNTHGLDMSETVELTFTAPSKMVEAAKYVCEAFGYTMNEYLVDALRGEIQCNWYDDYIQLSEPLRKKLVHEVEEILGKKP